MSQSDEERPAHLVDSTFFHLVRKAAHAFIAAKGKNPATEGKELADYLRSDAPLGPGERDLLAEMVAGEWRRRAGGSRAALSPDKKQEAVRRLRSLVDGGMKKEAAKLQVAGEFGISRTTLEEIESESIERERARNPRET